MIIVGLTGSIGMGKSTTAAMFRAQGIPVYDADAAVHELYAADGAAVSSIGHLVPTAIKEGAVDRGILREAVFEDQSLLKKIEAAVHPLLGQSRERFFAAHQNAPLVLLDIPLLFETGGEAHVDKVVVVSAPFDVQRDRVLARPDMDEERFQAILAKQVPDDEKRRRADFVIETGDGMENADAQVREIVTTLLSEPQTDQRSQT